MDRPWASTSLHDFWGARWQQTLRQHFLILGGYPLQTILRTITLYIPFALSPKTRAIWASKASDVGLVFGTFLASGVVHNYAMYPCGPTVDPATGVVLNSTGTPGAPTILFFVAQGGGIALERVYKAVTGRYVGGSFGCVWTWVWIVGGGQILCAFPASCFFSCTTSHFFPFFKNQLGHPTNVLITSYRL